MDSHMTIAKGSRENPDTERLRFSMSLYKLSRAFSAVSQRTQASSLIPSSFHIHSKGCSEIIKPLRINFRFT
jgi:hypothetical protein